MRYKNRCHTQASAERFVQKMRPLNAHKSIGSTHTRTQRLAERLQARILLAFDSANRHGQNSFVLADSIAMVRRVEFGQLGCSS
jgi:hypothetical protein